MIQHKFQFTRSWFRTRNQKSFVKYVLPYWKNKQFVYLEIGVFEGASFCWMLKNVLIHYKSRAIGIDPWLITEKLSAEMMENVRQRAVHNIEPFKDKCDLIRGSSVDVLRRMSRADGFYNIKRNSVDICMLDGNHHRLGVYDDARISFKLLKPGGWLIFDCVENVVRKKDHVKDGLKMFLEETPNAKLIWKDGFIETYEKNVGHKTQSIINEYKEYSEHKTQFTTMRRRRRHKGRG